MVPLEEHHPVGVSLSYCKQTQPCRCPQFRGGPVSLRKEDGGNNSIKDWWHFPSPGRGPGKGFASGCAGTSMPLCP